jgi:hypothetical protein
MLAILHLLVMFGADIFKSRRRLEAENLAYQFRAESLFTCSVEQVNFVHFGRFATFMP